MNGILGKITKIVATAGEGGQTGRQSLRITLKPACTMPDRAAVPTWLKDQELSVMREVEDPREVGGADDSIVLTAAESEPYLAPLVVEPAVTYGAIPETLRITLRWWKNDAPDPVVVEANGKRAAVPLIKSGNVYGADVCTGQFFGNRKPALPLQFAVAFDQWTIDAVVLPEGISQSKRRLVDGTRLRLENDWVALDVLANRAAGGIISLEEKGRGLDYFRPATDIMGNAFEYGGHVDRLPAGWNDRLFPVAMTATQASHEGRAGRLYMDGVVDEGAGMRTSSNIRLFDDLPLTLTERTVSFHPKKDEKKDEKPSEPIDTMQRLGMSFRCGIPLADDNGSAVRVLAMDGSRLATISVTQMHDGIRGDWRPSQGWILIERDQPKGYLLYLFDSAKPPLLRYFHLPHLLNLQPDWLPVAVNPDQALNMTLGLACGEVAGASTEGVWIGCRNEGKNGGAKLTLIALLEQSVESPSMRMANGSSSLEIPLRPYEVAGLDRLWTCQTDFDSDTARSRPCITVAGIAERNDV